MANGTAARVRRYLQYLNDVEKSLDDLIRDATGKMTAAEENVRERGGREMEAVMQDKRVIDKRRKVIQKRLDRGAKANSDGLLPSLYQSYVPHARRTEEQLEGQGLDEEGWVDAGAEGDGFWQMRLDEDPNHELKAKIPDKIKSIREQEAELEGQVKALVRNHPDAQATIDGLAAKHRKQLKLRRECLQTELEGGIDGSEAQQRQWDAVIQQYLKQTYKLQLITEWRAYLREQREASKSEASATPSTQPQKRRRVEDSDGNKQQGDQASSESTTPATARPRKQSYRGKGKAKVDEEVNEQDENVDNTSLSTRPSKRANLRKSDGPSYAEPALYEDDWLEEDDAMNVEEEGDSKKAKAGTPSPQSAQRGRPRKTLRSISRVDRTAAESTPAPLQRTNSPAGGKRARKSAPSTSYRRYPAGQATRPTQFTYASSSDESSTKEQESAEEQLMDEGADEQLDEETSSADLTAAHGMTQDGGETNDVDLKFFLKYAKPHQLLDECNFIVKSSTGEWVRLHCPVCKGNVNAPGEFQYTGLNFFRMHLTTAHDIVIDDEQMLIELCTEKVCDLDYLRGVWNGEVKPAEVIVQVSSDTEPKETVNAGFGGDGRLAQNVGEEAAGQRKAAGKGGLPSGGEWNWP